MTAIQVGTARSRPGEIVYGTFDAVPLPSGGSDAFPVIIVQGSRPGPVLWLTANIHGGEYNGVAVIHRLITSQLAADLRGTLVAIPSLNPAGLRVGQRRPYYLHGKDPNRMFPALDRGANTTPTALELAYARLFERIDATADFLIDLHDYGIKAIPFIFRDPVFYREARDRGVAHRLQLTVGEMIDALGLTVVNEYVSGEYLRLKLHRTVSGATLNTARIPAITIEVGGQRTVNNPQVAAVVSGIHNVLRWAGMLPGTPTPIDGVPVIDRGYPVHRTTHPRVPVACLIHTLVQPGDHVQAGDPVARMVDIYGRPVGTADGLLRTDYDGFVLGLFPGMAFYTNDSIIGLAIRDSNKLVVQLG
jgi:uncharacterized protein